MRLRALLSAAFAAALWLGHAGLAGAYPEFQFSTGNSRCNLCHVSPTGGGLLTDWGRDESADTISRGGNGDFLYGLYDEPEWIQLGADFRLAALARSDTAPARTAVFPMQGDLYALLRSGAWKLYAAIGPRAQARNIERPSVASRLVSREHYLMYQPSGKNYYVRAGRFLAPFGLRSEDHTRYIRRDLGFYAFEETYNLAGGLTEGRWEMHASLFTRVPDVLLGAGPSESGATLYAERLGSDSESAIAGQAKFAAGGAGTRTIAGGIGKYFFSGPEILLLGELDLVAQTFSADPGPSRLQLVSYLGASWWATRGLLVGVAHQHFDEDLSLSGTSRDGLQLSVQAFPRAKWEIMGLLRGERHGDFGRTSTLALLQLHYYL